MRCRICKCLINSRRKSGKGESEMNYKKGIELLNQIACDELLPARPKTCNVRHVKRIKALAKRKEISLREAYYTYQDRRMK